MASLPLTRVNVSEERQVQIRTAVGAVENLAGLARLARLEDVAALTALLADPEISGPIYTLPQQINHDTIAAFIRQHLSERERGEGLLLISFDDNGEASAYHDIQFWPQWAACELGGAVRRDRQSSGQGGAGATTAFSWLFEVIGVELICETAALDNIRTARLLERIGFTYMGTIESKLPAAGTRPSHYWELSKADWCSSQLIDSSASGKES